MTVEVFAIAHSILTGKSLLKIGTIPRKTMMFHLVCLVYVPIFASFRGVEKLSKVALKA